MSKEFGISCAHNDCCPDAGAVPMALTLAVALHLWLRLEAAHHLLGGLLFLD